MPTIKQLFFSVLGSVLFAFLFLSLLSYNPDDPAWSHIGGTGEITNIGGRLGAWVVDIFRVFFGFGAWWLVITIGYEILRLWWQREVLAWQLRFVAYGVLLICISTILAQLGRDAQQALYFGGVVGFEIYKFIVPILGFTATALLLILLMVVVATFTFHIRWKSLFGKLLGWLDNTQKQKSTPQEEVPDTPQEDTPLFNVVQTPTDSIDTAQPQQHSDSLENFLNDSGIRSDLLKKQERLAKEEERRQERLAKRRAKEEQKQEESQKQEQPKQTSRAKFFTTILDTVAPSEPKPSAPPPPSPPKSHAMSTLEYRLSLTPIPELTLLDEPAPRRSPYTDKELMQLSELLEIKLKEFNISARVMDATVGPVITLFEVELAAGIKVSRVTKIAEDLARSMSMTSLRVLPIIAGKPYIGIEVPNRHRQMVSLLEILDTDEFNDPNLAISMAIGVDISGQPIIADLAKAPHLLVAGMTGSGKSVVVNSFLMSMLLKRSPEELKLILIDPKQVELEPYADIPHLLTPVITDMTDATASLTWCVTEMERRYALLSKLRVRNIASFNQKVMEAEQNGEPLTDPLWRASDHVGDTPPKLKPLPFIVVVADEFADMLMQLGKTAEEPIVRLAQKARAAGIHLILATQRPTANVVTGLIKSNIPSRVALQVKTAIDSRIIIEESGADNLLGNGDMLFLAPGKNSTERLQGAFVSDDEVNRVCDAWRERGKPDYIDLSTSYTFEGEGSGDSATGGDDEYYNQAVAFVMETRKVSTSAIQRKLSIGYNRAARIVDMMEENGIVSPMDNGGKRQLLI
nr:DNA translocase FtsK [Moraxella oblonga]